MPSKTFVVVVVLFPLLLLSSKTNHAAAVSASNSCCCPYQQKNHHHLSQQQSSSSSSPFLLRGGGGRSVIQKKNSNTSTKSLRPSSATTSTTKRQRMIVLLLVSSALFNDILQVSMISPFIHGIITSEPPLGVGIDNGNAEIALGIFFASKDICQLLTAPIAGIWTQKYVSPKVALFSSTMALGVATFVFAHGQNFYHLLLARGAQGAASAAVLTGGLSLVAQTFPPDKRGSAIGLAYTGLALGLLCGPLFGGVLYEQFGKKGTFQIAGTVVLFNAFAQLVLLRKVGNNNNTHQSPSKRRRQVTAVSSSLSSSGSYKELLSNSSIMAVAAAIFAVHAVLGVLKPLSQVVLDREFGMGVRNRSLFVTIATGSYLLTAPVSGWVSDNVVQHKSTLLATSLMFMFISTIFFALRGGIIVGGQYYGRLWTFGIGIALAGSALGMAGASGQALLADIVDRDCGNNSSNNKGKGNNHNNNMYSMVYAISDMADSIGLIAGPIIGLTLSQLFGPSVGMGAVGLFCLLLVPFVLRIP